MLKLKPRLYQEKILDTATKGNTLVVLPTGLGKTLVAIMLGLVKEKEGQVLFMSPTKPLVEQHARTIEEVTGKEATVLHGGVSRAKREELWDAEWIVATPQTVQRDLVRGLDAGRFSLMVFDEAHRATGDYAYTHIAKHYASEADGAHILALTASPGSRKDKVNEILDALSIEHIEVRTEDDPDVKPYVKEKFINWTPVNLPKDYAEKVDEVKDALRTHVRALKSMGKLASADLSRLRKRKLLKLHGKLKGEYQAMSELAAALKAFHALELIETQGPKAYARYMGKLRKDKSKAAAKLLKELPAPPQQEHPKLGKLVRLLEKEPLPAIVFANYRSQVAYLVEKLHEHGIKAKEFIGQRKGMTQKQQKEAVQEFRDGEHEVLVSTSVGEEGIDMPSVSTLVFYEPVPSGIRHIQRRGRLRKGGRVYVLVAKGTRESGYYWAARAREKKMVRMLRGLEPPGRRKQATLERFGGDGERTIVVDDREMGVAKFLKNADVRRIEIGDFILSDRVAVERKTAADFVTSIVDGRLFDQAANMTEAYERPLIIIEGHDLFNQRNVHPNAIRGAMASLVLDWGVPVLFTRSPKETARLLDVISKREWKKDRAPSVQVPKAATLTDQQELLICSLPGINAVLSKRLLDIFGSPIEMFNASFHELMAVEGIGEKKAGKVRKVLDSQHGVEEE